MPSFSFASETSEISAAVLAQLLADKEVNSPTLVDCREPDEHAICHLPGSVLIPLATFPSGVEMLVKDKSSAIVVYCHHGMRSQRATAFLRRNGYAQALSLKGGIDTWAAEMNPRMRRY